MSTSISIVVPCYNEEEALPIYYKTITPVLENLGCNYELVFVDDGSKDNTRNIMKDLASKNSNVKYIIFSKNFGKEAAMYAGLENAKNEYVAVMDVDLQDPVEKLVEMYQILESENDIDCVATRRVSRTGEPPIRSWFARQFYKLINKWTTVEIVDGARDFRLMRRKMVNAVIDLKEKNRFSKGLFGFVGFKTKWLEYENIQRCAGETKWNFKKLFVYAIEGIVSFTIEPLIMVLKLGITLGVLDFIALITLIILQCCSIPVFNELSILILVLVLLLAISLSCMGIIALYLAKAYTEIKDRPIYIAKEKNTD